jgi:hypothetical protein
MALQFCRKFYFCIVKMNLQSILATLLLAVFLQASIGFALIDHHCIGCSSHAKETSFLIFTHFHNNNNDTCCASLPDTELCSITDNGHCNCLESNSEHAPQCEIDIQKLNEPFTVSLLSKFIPEPVEQELYNFLKFEISVDPGCYHQLKIKITDTSPFALSGADRLIQNAVLLI